MTLVIGEGPPEMRYWFENHLLDVDRRELHCGAELVGVEPQVFDLLRYVLAHRERVVTKDDLLKAVWAGRIVSDSTLSSRIAAARRAIGDSGETQTMIRTVRGSGIRFVAEVREEPPPSMEVRPLSVRMPPVATVTMHAGKPLVAVVSFAELCCESKHDCLGSGLAEDISIALSNAQSLSVLGRLPELALKGQGIAVEGWGRGPGARYVLAGSIRRLDRRIRITAQLIEADRGTQVWAERYDRMLTDVFALQDEIATTVAASVAAAIAGTERQHSDTNEVDQAEPKGRLIAFPG